MTGTRPSGNNIPYEPLGIAHHLHIEAPKPLSIDINVCIISSVIGDWNVCPIYSVY